ncbi:MAG: sigma-70 family RNA polymerase sigma factor [Clostridia bacterium]|nr:sigma-70 family RNA polymerase sigma factor [Clostridia bacterium]
MKETELSELLEMVKGRENADEAFSELLSRYMPLIKKRVATYFDCASDVSEPMQEASIALHSAAVTYDADKCDGVTFGLYAGVCISNRLKSLLRKKVRDSDKTEHFSEAEKLPSELDVESSVVTHDVCERVMTLAKNLLSGFEYEVFRMGFERYTTKDIAAALGKTPKSIDNAKFRISQRLRTNREIREILFDI